MNLSHNFFSTWKCAGCQDISLNYWDHVMHFHTEDVGSIVCQGILTSSLRTICYPPLRSHYMNATISFPMKRTWHTNQLLEDGLSKVCLMKHLKNQAHSSCQARNMTTREKVELFFWAVIIKMATCSIHYSQ